MKVAIIGNSHLAALKLAVRDRLFSDEEFEIVFWGVPGHQFGATSFEGGRFRTPYREFASRVSDGRHESLPADDFDAIIFHGVLIEFGRYLSSIARVSDDLQCFSGASLHEGLQSHIEELPAYQLVRSLRSEYDRPIVVSPLAMKSEDSGELKNLSVTVQGIQLLNSHIVAILSTVAADYVAQPPHTMRDCKYTKREFCLNSVRLGQDLSIAHPDDDYNHMNSQYGACVLRDIAVKLSARGNTTDKV
jgi:hypothetical protein